ncbi:MAG TPA: hypothetical protein ENJ79_06060 [Gammaproteobacteria bacterium]|nr:hypothetical protein [Gammaproteobacteria bacterium]
MTKRRQKRLMALQAFERLCHGEMEALRDQGRVARAQLESIESRLSAIDGEIQAAEQGMRAAMDRGSPVSVDEFRMTSDYLHQQHLVHRNQEKQRRYAERQLASVQEKIIQQHLKIRGVGQVRRRKLYQLGLELQKQQMIALDEAWIQRQGERDD